MRLVSGRWTTHCLAVSCGFPCISVVFVKTCDLEWILLRPATPGQEKAELLPRAGRGGPVVQRIVNAASRDAPGGRRHASDAVGGAAADAGSRTLLQVGVVNG